MKFYDQEQDDYIELTKLKGEPLRKMRRKIQIIFQDPYGSLNPRMSCGAIVGEPLKIHGLAHGKEYQDRVEELLTTVGLHPYFATRYPHEFSGGQRQRIGIARALASNPSFIVCDEPISALDVSIQAKIINLLEDLQHKFGLTYLFIAHDLAVVRHISDRIAVMYLGKIAEVANREELYERTRCTRIPRRCCRRYPSPTRPVSVQRERVILQGDVPSPMNPPKGCVFHTRCPIAADVCREEIPELRNLGSSGVNEHWVACHRA